jgi:hypothetical protein
MPSTNVIGWPFQRSLLLQIPVESVLPRLRHRPPHKIHTRPGIHRCRSSAWTHSPKRRYPPRRVRSPTRALGRLYPRVSTTARRYGILRRNRPANSDWCVSSAFRANFNSWGGGRRTSASFHSSCGPLARGVPARAYTASPIDRISFSALLLCATPAASR